MSASSSASIKAHRFPLAGPVLAVGTAVLLAACSAKSPSYSGASNVYSWNHHQGSRVMAAPVQRAVELEDDGLPVQDAPPVRIRHVPDDPREPFSPNYGGPSHGRTTDRAGGDASVGDVAATDDGYPVPMSPQEAGISFVEPPDRPRRASYGGPLSRCVKSAGGWMCTR